MPAKRPRKPVDDCIVVELKLGLDVQLFEPTIHATLNVEETN